MLDRLLIASVAAAGIFFVSTFASADTLTLDSCDSMGCKGSTLELDVQQIGDTDHWDVTLTIDTTNYTGSKSGISQVGFLAIKNWDSATLTSNPDGVVNEFSSPVYASVNANSLCDNAKDSGKKKVCSWGFADITEGPQTWTFEIWGGTMMDVEDWHIGGQYADLTLADGASASDGLSAQGVGDEQVGTAGHIISAGQDDPVIPEPSAALVFAVGFGVVSAAVRRKN